MLNKHDGEGKPLSPHIKKAPDMKTYQVFVASVVQERHRHENTSLLMCFHAQCGVEKAMTTKRHQCWCVFMLGVCRGHGKGADHENAAVFATLVYICVGVGKVPSTKRHQCLFVFGMDPWLRKGAENTPLAGGFRAQNAFSVVEYN
jgi:hypothetical protein